MPLLQIIVLIIVIGVLLYVVNTYVPMDAQVKKILNAVVLIALMLWLLWWALAIFGLLHYKVPVPP